MLIQNSAASTSALMIGSEVAERVDHSIYLGRLISPDEYVFDETTTRNQKVRSASVSLMEWVRY